MLRALARACRRPHCSTAPRGDAPSRFPGGTFPGASVAVRAPRGWSASSALARQARDPLIATLLRSLTRPRPLHLEARRRPAVPGEAWPRLHGPEARIEFSVERVL